MDADSKTATERLWELLYRRDVRYRTMEVHGMPVTFFDSNDLKASVTDHPDGYMIANIVCPTPEQAIAATLGTEITGETSDGYHTFNELYHHRAVLFSVIVANYRDMAWKARKHHDGTMYDGMFIVGIDTPHGQASYHYDLDTYWGMFDCEEREFAPEWDGHTPDEAIKRIGKLAIAATLGDERLSSLEEKAKLQGDYIYKLLKERDELCGGKLTAEQVRETVEKHWHDLPAEYDMPEATALPEYSYNWQAIADELNAELGSGECENIAKNWGEFECSECGFYADFGSDLHRVRSCPDCGKAVKR